MSKSITITAGGLEKVVARLAPPDLADDWDNVGLLVGDASARVRRVLVALEASASVLEEAARRGAQALVVHHPVIFKPVRKVVTTDVVGGLVLKLAAHGIALIAAHTNLDRSPEGTSRALADLVGLAREGERFLVPASQNHGCKFVVFVPEGHVDAVIEAAARAGAGVIGAYSHCTFRSPGVGTYIPLEGARPFAGKVGRLEQAAELRLECLVSRERLGALIEAVRAAHPYEEMAYDVYPLVEGEAQWGLGLIGALERPVTLGALARRVRRKLPGAACIRVVGDPSRRIERAALSSGSGSSLVPLLSPDDADVFITGELDHHAALELRERGLAAICLGHFESEVIVVPRVAAWLREQPEILGAGVDILESECERSPFSQ